jgi:hypothetical protein
MKRLPAIYLLSIVFAAAPLGFGVIRAIRSGDDLRYLWLAIAALLGAAVVMAVGKARSQELNIVLMLTVVAWVVSTLLAGLTVRLLGVTMTPVGWVVACAFGGCCATSRALDALSRPQMSK